MPNQLNNSFQKKINFSLNVRDALSFIALGVIVWYLNVFAHMAFPSQNFIPYIVRTAVSAVSAFILIFVSIKLLKKCNVPDALGLKLSQKSLFNFILGVIIAAVVIVMLGLMLYVFVPYHFVAGPLKIVDVIREAHTYFWGNFIEELLFRGYLLIILSQLMGWRIAVCIMALPFGLFHLPGPGFSIAGLKMILTTATYSFVFCYAFILTGTIWTAIGVHVASNVLLHAISGLDGSKRGMFIPVFENRWPVNYDPGLITFVTTAIVMSLILFLLIKRYKTFQF